MAAVRTLALPRPVRPPEAIVLVGKGALLLAGGALGALAVLRVAGDRAVDRVRQDLERTPASGRVFAEAMVADLPDPARRYFRHAVRPGTPLASQVHLTQ